MNPKKKPQPPENIPEDDDLAEPPYRDHMQNLRGYWADQLGIGAFLAVAIGFIALLVWLFRFFFIT